MYCMYVWRRGGRGEGRACQNVLSVLARGGRKDKEGLMDGLTIYGYK